MGLVAVGVTCNTRVALVLAVSPHLSHIKPTASYLVPDNHVWLLRPRDYVRSIRKEALASSKVVNS